MGLVIWVGLAGILFKLGLGFKSGVLYFSDSESFIFYERTFRRRYIHKASLDASQSALMVDYARVCDVELDEGVGVTLLLALSGPIGMLIGAMRHARGKRKMSDKYRLVPALIAVPIDENAELDSLGQVIVCCEKKTDCEAVLKAIEFWGQHSI